MSGIGTIGPNFDQVDAGTTTNGVGAKFTMGSELQGVDGTVYRYVQAGEAITTIINNPLQVKIRGEWQATILDEADVQPGMIGWAPHCTSLIPDNSFFWARIRGIFKVRAAVGALPNVRVRINDNGIVSTATATTVGERLAGISLLSTASASASAQDPGTRPYAIVSGAITLNGA